MQKATWQSCDLLSDYLNNLKANHNFAKLLFAFANTVIAGVNLNNLKANHNYLCAAQERRTTVIAGVNLNNLKANHNRLFFFYRAVELLSLA